LSTGVVFGDVWRGGVAARPRVLADSDFSFIALSSEVISGAVWDGLSSAMLSAAVASATVHIHVQTKIIVRFDFISFWLQSTLGDCHYKFSAEQHASGLGTVQSINYTGGQTGQTTNAFGSQTLQSGGSR
jgi:hypothetical protein